MAPHGFDESILVSTVRSFDTPLGLQRTCLDELNTESVECAYDIGLMMIFGVVNRAMIAVELMRYPKRST